MDKVVLYDNNGTLNILVPMDTLFDSESRDRKMLENQGIAFSSDLDVLEWIISKDIPAGNSFSIVDKSIIPTDRTFRGAWKQSGNTIDHDLDKVRSIIREQRNKALEKLDSKAYAESRKPNGNVSSINTKAQRLRDIPEDSNFMSSDISVLKSLLAECTL